MTRLLTAQHWVEGRNAYMMAARDCRAVLTDPAGNWRYATDDQRVKDAVSKWVQRARNAHALALGWQPVIAKAVVVNQSEAVTGPLYAA